MGAAPPRRSVISVRVFVVCGLMRQYQEICITRYPDDQSLLAACHSQSVDLLKRNLTPDGVLAASPTLQADKRGYTAIFGRDAAVCAIGMVLSGDQSLARAAAAGLHTLAEHQAPNGQIAKFVDVQRQEADFWYYQKSASCLC